MVAVALGPGPALAIVVAGHTVIPVPLSCLESQIRASKSNEIWHVDTTVTRLLDGSRAYLHAIIDNFSRRILSWTVEKLVAYYIREHSSRLPHSAFHGQTPREMYFGTGSKVPDELDASRQKARQPRAEANREKTCSACETPVVSVS